MTADPIEAVSTLLVRRTGRRSNMLPTLGKPEDGSIETPQDLPGVFRHRSFSSRHHPNSSTSQLELNTCRAREFWYLAASCRTLRHDWSRVGMMMGIEARPRATAKSVLLHKDDDCGLELRRYPCSSLPPLEIFFRRVITTCFFAFQLRTPPS